MGKKMMIFLDVGTEYYFHISPKFLVHFNATYMRNTENLRYPDCQLSKVCICLLLCLSSCLKFT